MFEVLQINASYKPAFIYGGPTMSVSKLSEVLVKHNIPLEVLTTTANGKAEIDVKSSTVVDVDGVPVRYFKRVTKDHTHFSPALYSGLWGRIGEARGERQEARDKRQEARVENQESRLRGEGTKSDLVVHIHTWWNLVSIFSCLIAVWKNVPVVLSPRGTLSNYSFGNRNSVIKRMIHQFLGRQLLNRCHFHVTSENERRAIEVLVNPKSISVIPNLVNLPGEIPQRALMTEEGKLKLLFFSRIEQKKGLELLFAALAEIPLRYDLTIAGSGDESYVEGLKKLSQQLGLDDNISWIGQQSPELKFEVMASHDVLLLPSYDENFANVVIESLSCGTAVLISENVGLSDYVAANDLGWVCSNEPADIRQKLLECAGEGGKLNMIREQAPAKIKLDFSDDAVCRKYIDMYKRVLGYSTSFGM